ncbi:MAG: hypothetical protein O7J95_07170, partial [Planctomycetota bacterium]|nr:hypothetical protein [Planctomycetota bacterium]
VVEALDSDDQDDLPADLRVLLSGRTPSIPDITSVSDPLGSDDSTDPEMVSPDGSDDTLDPEVSVVDPAVPELTERVYSDGGQFSIKVPVGWEVKKLENTLQVVGPAGENGVTPSFNVMSVSTGGLSFGECVDLLQEEQSSALQQFEVLTKGGLTLNDRQAYEIIARGSMDGKVLVLRQVLVPGDDESVVLFSGYSVGASEDSTFSQIEAALQSLESVE